MSQKEALLPPALQREGTDQTVDWLLEGDPAIRWQTLRDLSRASDGIVERERTKVARDGWGARLLARQGRDGRWALGQSSDGGLYSPKWISTTYTMLLLRDFGLSPSNRKARRACALLLDEGLQRDGGINYGWRGSSETCITGMVLSILSYFHYDEDRWIPFSNICSASKCLMAGGIASDVSGRRIRQLTPLSVRSKGCGCTNCTADAKSGRCNSPSAAAANSF